MNTSSADLLTLWIYFAGVVSSCLLLIQAFSKRKNFALINVFIIYTIMSFSYAFYYDNRFPGSPILAIVMIATGLAYGPSLLYLSQFMTRVPASSLVSRRHYIPSFSVLTGLCLLNLFYPELMKEYSFQLLVKPELNILHWIVIAGLCGFMGYFYLGYKTINIKSGNTDLKKKNTYAFYMIFGMSRAMLTITGMLIKNTPMITVGLFLNTLSIFLFLFFTARYPKIFQNMVIELSEKKHSNISIDNLNIDSIKSKLDYLMKDEMIFRDPELKAIDVATRLGMYHQQFTKFLLENYRQNFKMFLNTRRTEYAQKLLLSDTEKTVLHIAFEAGFNSKSAFNDVFKKHTHMTPLEYRNENLKSFSVHGSIEKAR